MGGGVVGMSDGYRVRFDGREWWACREHTDDRVTLYESEQDAREMVLIGGLGEFTLPAHMVERIEDDLPPEPTEPATVLFDRDDVTWRRVVFLDPRHWSGLLGGRWEVLTWGDLIRERGPLHPYPKAARDEIERLTAQRDGYATLRDQYVDQLTEERDNLRGRIDTLQARIFRARKAVAAGPYRMAEILRGEA